MKINPIKSGPHTSSINSEKQQSKKANNQEQVTDRYDPAEKKATYNKPKAMKGEAINKLKQDGRASQQQLIKLVRELLKGQGYNVNKLKHLQDVDLEGVTPEEAAELISANGPLGAEETSDRIVEFAKSLAGGDKEKIEELRDAIKEGFAQAEEILGELPEVSKETYRLVMEKLDKWAEE